MISRRFPCCGILAFAVVLLVFQFAPPTAAATPPASSPPDNWTLIQAVDFALENSPDIHVALQRLAAAGAMIGVAQSYSLPTIRLGGEYSQTDTPMLSFGNILNQGALDNSIDFNDPGRTDSMALQAMLAYRFYDGGKTSADIEASEANQRAARQELAAVQQQLAFEVVRRFSAIEQTKDLVMVRKSAVEAIEASLAVGKARYEVGDLLQEDLLNLELQRAREEEGRLRAGHDHELAITGFWNLLGIPSDHRGVLPSATEPLATPAHLDNGHRPELLAIEERLASARAMVESARSGEKVVIDGFARYQYEYGTVLGETGDGWQAGVRLNYDLYDGQRTEAEITGAKARLAELSAMRQKVMLALDLELRQAEIGYQQSLEQLELTSTMVATAEESTRLSRIRFQEGVILASDLIEMEMRLTDARSRRAAAQAESRVALANLRRAAGLEQFADLPAGNRQVPARVREK